MEKKRLPDTPWHLGYTKKEKSDPRRHKARCVFLEKEVCKCKYDGCYMQKCGGSAHCKHYSEVSKNETEKQLSSQELEKAVRDSFAQERKRIQMELFIYKGKRYFKINLSEEESILIPYNAKISQKELNNLVKEYLHQKRKG